jgi:hypothetical protein
LSRIGANPADNGGKVNQDVWLCIAQEALNSYPVAKIVLRTTGNEWRLAPLRLELTNDSPP